MVPRGKPGRWRDDPSEGLRIALPHCEIEFEAGVSIAGEERAGIDKACALCAGADVVVLCLGEFRRHERGSGVSGGAGASRPSARTCPSRSRDRNSCRRRHLLGPPANGDVAGRAGASGARHLVSGRQGRVRHRGCADRALQSNRATCGHLAARNWRDSDFLRHAIFKPSL